MIRLVIVDVDGCLTPGEGRPWDLTVFQFISDLNRQARLELGPFSVTLCTGRQEPYVEALMQAIDGHMPAIYENGGGLYFPAPYRFIDHPTMTPQVRTRLSEIRARLREQIVDTGLGMFQPGKEVSITLYPANPGMTFEELAEAARRALDGTAGGFSVYASVSSVEILLDGVDKGTGAEWLARETGIPLAQIAGIGDAPGDLRFLTRVGFSAAPANAVAPVKQIVQYVSPFEDGRGVVDILSKWTEKGGDPPERNSKETKSSNPKG